MVVVVVVVIGGGGLTGPSLEHDEKAHGDREAQEIRNRKALGHKNRWRHRFGHPDHCHSREFFFSISFRFILVLLSLIFGQN